MATSKLKVIMAELDVSAKELAAVTGLSKNTISNYMNGHTRPQIDNAYLISEALGVHISRAFPNLYKYANQ